MTSPDFRRRHLLVAGTSIGGLLLLQACSSTSVLQPDMTAEIADATEAALPMVNRIRAGRGQSALKADPVAVNAARDQAIRMAAYGKMSHFVGGDSDFLARMKRMEVKLPAAENIATGQDQTEEAVLAWENSPKHLDNMLGPYRGLGVVMARNANSGNRPFWAMVLSSRDMSLFSRDA